MEQCESSAPQFIRDFSKEQSPDDYSQTVSKIQTARQEFHVNRKGRLEKKSTLEDSTSQRQQTLGETLTKLQTLRDRINQLSGSKYNRVKHYFLLKKNRNTTNTVEKEYQQLTEQQDAEINEQQENLDQIKAPPEIKEAKDLLSDFYQKQKEKWANSDYNQQDIKNYFTQEHLSSLSLSDYITLLKRFPSEMVTHVTRQGVRDHTGLAFYHETGAGKYSNGFIKIIQDGRLRSPLGIQLAEKENKKAIAKFLRLDQFSNREEALEELSRFTEISSQGYPGSYVDQMAIHFATEEVADCYYGSEKGNEIFFVYPSALIASEYYFRGQLNQQGGGNHNDQWVWANEEQGIDINSGLVFIPQEAQVDKRTGSRYQLDENNNPIKNSEYHLAFRRVVDSPDFDNFAQEVKQITGQLDQNIDSTEFSPRNQSLIKRLEPYRQKLEQQFGIKDRRLQNSILEYQHIQNITVAKEGEKNNYNDEFTNIDAQIDGALEDTGIFFIESQDTIRSQDFWESYFNQHPQKRPSKIVYYRGQDPTLALQYWKQENGLIKKASDANIGFNKHQIQGNNPRATAGIDRFQVLAREIIQDYYAQKESSPQ